MFLKVVKFCGLVVKRIGNFGDFNGLVVKSLSDLKEKRVFYISFNGLLVESLSGLKEKLVFNSSVDKILSTIQIFNSYILHLIFSGLMVKTLRTHEFLTLLFNSLLVKSLSTHKKTYIFNFTFQ